MSEHEIIEILEACRPVYSNLHEKIQHELSEEEKAILKKFKAVWEDGLYTRPEVIAQAGMTQREIAFLGGYLYYAQVKKAL